MQDSFLNNRLNQGYAGWGSEGGESNSTMVKKRVDLMLQNPNSQETEMLTCAALLTLLGRKSRQGLYDLMRRDESFPRPKMMGSEFSIAWRRSEVMAWIDAQPRAEFNGLSAVERRQQSARVRGQGAAAKGSQPYIEHNRVSPVVDLGDCLQTRKS